MDWYAHADDAPALRGLRQHIRAYLDRHSGPGADVDGAEVIAAELLQNAATHAGGPMWVSLTWPGRNPQLRVTELGPGFELDARLPADPVAKGGGRGLFIVSRLATDLSAEARRSGGSVVTATLPVTRPDEVPVVLPHRSVAPLPGLEEVGPDGAFGREAFLRALVVQMALSVDYLGGPAVAESAITQVGTDVGGQMEAAYRLAHSVVGRLTPAQVADCLVRLKHAIDGDFRVVEANADRVVLVNDRCPFGEAVRRAPALCRVTSSVFGGIAARNSERGARVVLEERIALGDDQCRVVVRFDVEAADTPEWAHRYPARTG